LRNKKVPHEFVRIELEIMGAREFFPLIHIAIMSAKDAGGLLGLALHPDFENNH